MAQSGAVATVTGVEPGDLVNTALSAGAVIVAIIAVTIAAKARSDSRRSADVLKRFATASEDAIAHARRSADVAERAGTRQVAETVRHLH